MHPSQRCTDDIHNLLLPETIRDPKVDAFRQIRNVDVARLLINGPPYVAWSVTGSNMVMGWMAIAHLDEWPLRPLDFNTRLLLDNTTTNLPVSSPARSCKAG